MLLGYVSYKKSLLVLGNCQNCAFTLKYIAELLHRYRYMLEG